MNQGLFLAESTKLTVENGTPFLRHANSKVCHRLQLGEAIALSFLGAVGRENDASTACAEHIVGGAMWVDYVIDRYWSYLGGDSPRTLDFGWLDEVEFGTLAFAKPGRRNAAPQALVWLVTLACNRRCPYCFYEVTPHGVGCSDGPADATFSTAAVFRMLAEMQDIGTAELYLTGGEPLLRRDLIDILAEADRRRVKTYLSTKYPIDQSLANRLTDANIYSITYSLDAGSSRIADALTGDKGFYSEAIRALEALNKAGLDPEVNAVLTRANADRLDDLAGLLVDCGVARLSISLFIPPVPTRPSTNALTPVQDDAALILMVRDLAHRWSGQIDIRLGDSGQNVDAAPDFDHPVCEVGFTEMHVLPNGTATRCRYLPAEKALEIGSLENLTIMDIWRGASLGALVSPPRSDYEGTACATCASFQSCNDRGRCYVSALQSHGTLSGPDSFCRVGSGQ